MATPSWPCAPPHPSRLTPRALPDMATKTWPWHPARSPRKGKPLAPGRYRLRADRSYTPLQVRLPRLRPLDHEEVAIEDGDRQAIQGCRDEEPHDTEAHPDPGDEPRDQVEHRGREPLVLQRMPALAQRVGRRQAAVGDQRDREHEDARDDEARHDQETEAEGRRQAVEDRSQEQLREDVQHAEERLDPEVPPPDLLAGH